MVSTATRCAAAKRAATARESVTSFLPGGNIPACQPMVATMFGSFRVQACAMTSPSASVTTPQKRPKRSTARSVSQPPWAVSHRGVVKWWKVTTGSTPRSRSPTHWRR